MNQRFVELSFVFVAFLWLSLRSTMRFVSVSELVNTASRIYQLHFSSIKRMRSVRNFQFDQWVFVTIFPFNGFLSSSTGFSKKRVIIRHVLEHNVSVIFWVNSLFHFNSIFRMERKDNQMLLLKKRQFYFVPNVLRPLSIFAAI